MSTRVVMTSYTYIGDEPIRVPITEGQPKVVIQPGERFESSYKLNSQLFKTDEQLAARQEKLKEDAEAGKKAKTGDDSDVESLKAQILTLDPEAKIHPQTGAKKLQEMLNALLEKKAQEEAEAQAKADADAKAKDEAEAGKTVDEGIVPPVETTDVEPPKDETVPPTDETTPPAQ